MVGEHRVGTVASLTRFAVKGTAGEALSSVTVDGRGLVHDRVWAAYTADGGIVSGKTTSRFRRVDGLLSWRSTVADGEVPVLHSPGGQSYRVDDPAAAEAVSESLGQPITLRREASIPHHDDSGLHLVTTSSVRTLGRLVESVVDVRRFRANIQVQTDDTGFTEDTWVGRVLSVGSGVILRVDAGMPRCVMVDREQATVGAVPSVLKTLGRKHGTILGVQATVLRPGRILLGDTAFLSEPGPRPHR